ncbi:hypothetical protein SCUCBS95973_002755 [Sporothrix curviconia]|uniref:Ams2/SPT21 N-terminal domain-containing protein n=1 Tax=Sporothrix curviconia TaxID=1260050 RepID=A0ABP0B9J1_9PEZI
MASPMTTGSPAAYGWPPAAPNQQPQGMPAANDTDEMGMQVRPMALKVLYTFDKDSKVNCLARLPQTLQVQVIPIDERSWIGIVDLRLCIQAMTQGSPELSSQSELDYAIYAVDVSEPDTPLVGQGMLSWVMDPAAAMAAQQFDDGPKMVTGRVTKNMMALFGNGVRETLEVRLRLTAVARAARMESTTSNSNRGNSMDASQNQMRGAPTPTDTTEWNSFLQANPMLGRSASIATMQSPNMALALPDMAAYAPGMPPTAGMAAGSFDMGAHHAMSRPGSRPGSRQSTKSAVAPSSYLPARPGSSMLAQQQHSASAFASASASSPQLALTNEDLLAPAASLPETAAPVINPRPARPSRPSSRSSRSRAPTGRPRGRPRKTQPTDGNTSAAEEAPTDADADGDDMHKKKRVKTTKANYPLQSTLDSAPDSLRVAASTSGALRTLRPLLPAGGSTDGPSQQNHLQEVPRAPTPVPRGGPPSQHHARKMMAQKARRESLANLDPSSFADPSYPRSLAAGSPTDSIAPSPENYTPEDSPADITSSPPVPRTTSYVPRSSPIPSSPPLPAMRRLQPDSGFMSGEMDDLLFDDDETALLHNNNNNKLLPPPTPQENEAPTPNVTEFSQAAQTPAPTVPAALTPQTSGETEQPVPGPVPEPVSVSEPVPAPATVPAPAQQAPPLQEQSEVPTTTAAPRPKQPNQWSQRRIIDGSADQFPFLAMNPGPPELLPTTILYNPPPQPKGPQPRQRGKNQRANSMVAKPPPPQLERSHSEPANSARLEQQQQQPQQPSQLQQQAFPLPSDAADESTSFQSRVSPFPTVDVPDDMKELAKFLASSNDSSRETSQSSNPAESLKSPPQAQPTLPQQPAAEMARVAHSLPPFPLPTRATAVPASDPPALPPLTLPAPPPPPTAFSEAPCPPSDADVPSGRSSKNLVRKAAIRERLKQAIESGEMPPFCQNCGAIETPTWRKMWIQDHDGEPGFYDFSDKSNPVICIEILERDSEGKTTRYRLVRKAMSNSEAKQWTQMLLCNPCGIWLAKANSHRPRDRWDKDSSRLNCSRTGNSARSRSRKSRAKSDAQAQPTSEAYFTTDPVGPEDANVPNSKVSYVVLPDTPPAASRQANAAQGQLPLPAPTSSSAALPPPPPPPPPPASTTTSSKPTTTAEPPKEAEISQGSLQQDFQAGSNRGPASGGGSAKRRQEAPGSTHSRGSGTAASPIAVDDQFGTTRRLLFPSPRKDGVLKVLGELAVNVIGTVLGSPKTKTSLPKFETVTRPEPKEDGDETDKAGIAGKDSTEQDDMEDLFGTPPPPTRPSTPPPKSGSQDSPSFATGPFKTPTRPTPSHRPITRSVSKSIVRSAVVTCPQSPPMEGLMLLQRTPSKTPRSVAIPSSAGRSRRMASVTPGRQQQQHHHHHQSLHVPLQLDGVPFDTPLTSTLNQLLSEANDFTTGSPSHGLTDLDLASIANLNSDDLGPGFDSSAGDIDFDSYLDTDLIMPGTSPLLGRKSANHSHKHHSQHVSFGSEPSFEASENLWSDFNDAMDVDLVTERMEQTA